MFSFLNAMRLLKGRGNSPMSVKLHCMTILVNTWEYNIFITDENSSLVNTPEWSLSRRWNISAT